MSPQSVDRYAVVGNPVAHSQSPLIHSLFAQAVDDAISYERMHCELDNFEPTVRAFAASGACGCNVTVPFKQEAWGLASVRSERAQLAQAANVLCSNGDDGWFADNTDGIGLRRDIEQNAGVSLQGLRVLLVGAGGAAAGVLGPLLTASPRCFRVANRDASKANQLVARHAALAAQHRVQLQAAGLNEIEAPFDVVINATSTSLGGSIPPIAATVIARGALVIDMMYGAAARPFLTWAAAHGGVPRDGLGMLVEQAAESFWLWRHKRVATHDVIGAVAKRLAETH